MSTFTCSAYINLSLIKFTETSPYNLLRAKEEPSSRTDAEGQKRQRGLFPYQNDAFHDLKINFKIGGA